MSVKVEIDPHSGFCGGVIRAIGGAEKYLDAGNMKLYSLGSIVHNEAELHRLQAKGLLTIGLDEIKDMEKGSTVLIRAHGEPPSTYEAIKAAGLEFIDCTCPVVLKLQKRIREVYPKIHASGGQILIYGKVGHAEVLGLMGQVAGDALVIENMEMYESMLSQSLIRLDGPIEVFSQTTKSPAAFKELCLRLEQDMISATGMEVEEFRSRELLKVHNTICAQVSNRHKGLTDFASSHSIIIFVAGRESSNGKVLCNLCKDVNERTYRVGSEEELDSSWFKDGDEVGVCGATSTPKWLLEAVAKKILVLSR